MNRRSFVLALAALVASGPCAVAQQAKTSVEALMALPVADVVAGIESGNPDFMHPATAIALAKRLFADDKQKDEAVFWFYAGQLRFRIHLAARRSIDPAGDPALFASLMDTVGKPINQYAFGDISALVATFDRVLEWDGKHRDPFTPAEAYAKERNEQRAGLEGLKAEVLRRREEIKADRTKAGLPNK